MVLLFGWNAAVGLAGEVGRSHALGNERFCAGGLVALNIGRARGRRRYGFGAGLEAAGTAWYDSLVRVEGAS